MRFSARKPFLFHSIAILNSILYIRLRIYIILLFFRRCFLFSSSDFVCHLVGSSVTFVTFKIVLFSNFCFSFILLQLSQLNYRKICVYIVIIYLLSTQQTKRIFDSHCSMLQFVHSQSSDCYSVCKFIFSMTTV